jgi:hypothetical protein
MMTTTPIFSSLSTSRARCSTQLFPCLFFERMTQVAITGRHWCVGRPALCHRWLSARPTPGPLPGVSAPLSPAGLSPLSRPRRRLLPAKVFKMKPLHHSLEMCYARGKEEQGSAGSFGTPPDRRSPEVAGTPDSHQYSGWVPGKSASSRRSRQVFTPHRDTAR